MGTGVFLYVGTGETLPLLLPLKSPHAQDLTSAPVANDTGAQLILGSSQVEQGVSGRQPR